jgi:hypothetical protein
MDVAESGLYRENFVVAGGALVRAGRLPPVARIVIVGAVAAVVVEAVTFGKG